MEFFRRGWQALAASGLMALTLWGVKATILPANVGIIEDLVGLATLAAAGSLAYAIALLGLWALCGRPAGSAEDLVVAQHATRSRSEEHTSELQSLMRNSYAVFCLKKKKKKVNKTVSN